MKPKKKWIFIKPTIRQYYQILQDFKDDENILGLSVVIWTTIEKLPLGLFISYVKDGKIYVGYSRCNYNLKDVFDLKLGIRLALDKAIWLTKNATTETSLNREFKKAFKEFVEFCTFNYSYLFKNKPMIFNFMSENEYFRKYLNSEFKQDFIKQYATDDTSNFSRLVDTMFDTIKEQYEKVKQYKLLLPNI